MPGAFRRNRAGLSGGTEEDVGKVRWRRVKRNKDRLRPAASEEIATRAKDLFLRRRAGRPRSRRQSWSSRGDAIHCLQLGGERHTTVLQPCDGREGELEGWCRRVASSGQRTALAGRSLRPRADILLPWAASGERGVKMWSEAPPQVTSTTRPTVVAHWPFSAAHLCLCWHGRHSQTTTLSTSPRQNGVRP